MDEVKKEVISWWLRKVLLPFIGRRFPDFFRALLHEVSLPKHGQEILELRYVLDVPWKLIPERVGLEDRQVFSVHKKCIEKLIIL